VTIETPSLGDRDYLATDGSAALVVDAQRDFGRVLAVAGGQGVTITDVFETHNSQRLQQVAEAQCDLVRIGIDAVEAAATGSPQSWAGADPMRAYPVGDFAALARALADGPVVVLDVSRSGEWDAAHVSGSLKIPLDDLPGRIGEVPGGEVWVHRQSGYRASVAASLLDAAGRDVVLIDDHFARAQESDITTAAPDLAAPA
jgi:rhodanese-related sulfurtransferase